MDFVSTLGYGWGLHFNNRGLKIILNGYWFSIFKSLHTGKWRTEVTQNAWRKTKKKIRSDLNWDMKI